MNRLRAPAYPLVTIDPYFSIWSFNDKLYQDSPRHWTGKKNALLGIISVDKKCFRFMGKIYSDNLYPYEPPVIEQKDVYVTPLKTVYTFENDNVRLTVSFMSPLLLDDLKLASRPVSYISYTVETLDSKEHDISVYIGAEAGICSDSECGKIRIEKTDNGISCTKGDEKVLYGSGDRQCIDWGSLHLFSHSHKPFAISNEQAENIFLRDFRNRDIPIDDNFGKNPYLILEKSYKLDSKISDFVCIAYDDIHSIRYFGKMIDAYYKKDGESFKDICQAALDEYENILKRTERFDYELLLEAKGVSEKYADILSLAYRQSIAAHKITYDDGEIQFFSKECYSNGCIATVDVTYPSIPLFLKYNPDLVEGMLNPIFKFAYMPDWEYDFAPHDAGQYPIAEGQVYGYGKEKEKHNIDKQMPVEECGNMIICVAALCHARGDFSYYKKHRDILTKWVKYLIKYGLDPANQLCTDDFAGHLSHNCNLAVKAIVGIAAFGYMENAIGFDGEGHIKMAREYAAEWKKKAFNGRCYKLAYDKDDSWSIKYNLAWDKILDLKIFDDEIFKTEVAEYKRQIKRYGLPLDSRSDYTKSDWQMWSLRLDDSDSEYSDMIIDAMWDMLNESASRVPFTDWYFASSALQRGFQNRTVQGGLFIKLI